MANSARFCDPRWCSLKCKELICVSLPTDILYLIRDVVGVYFGVLRFGKAIVVIIKVPPKLDMGTSGCKVLEHI